ncbi:fumarylacetoacetate hydrolase family protein [Edaphobacter albus]|uniref:fumarylacetoacetate hydrolase family protein n=1 Tax=Edaphobacter sp. 4G125 TaxID=2763071 RepID=UPI001646430C|nr:fumarylacetoacetate hydrolase family protein [Edaphobacter sp. 4G125]QNI36968.1 fumarylacetoacetate hydrolase family protein [Edaphobacter sp. 4G125]
MKYCRYLSDGVAQYALVEERDGLLWAVQSMAPPEEDLAACLAALNQPADRAFTPTPLANLSLLPPVTPSKIICIGRNYREHAAELGNEVPKEPLLFLKPPSSLLAPGGTVKMPALSKRVDYEGELAIVIGQRCSHLSPAEDPLDYIRGYTIVNDVTARDIQKSDGQWTRGKGWDTFCPVGPIVSDEIDPLDGDPVTVTTRLNGQVKQNGSTADLIFPLDFLLRYISASITLEPGDLIPTGTPAGVGPVQTGDTVEVEITGLGVLKNSFSAE